MNTPLDHRAALHSRRVPLHERLAPLAAEWQSINGYQVCARVHGHPASATRNDDGPWLRCLSHRPRIGFKGRGTTDWLHSAGVMLPGTPNRWCRDASGAVVARLGAQDFLIFDEGDGSAGLTDTLVARWQHDAPSGAYIVPRQHGLACIAIDGRRALEVLARLCAVDVGASFGDDAIAQTQVALMSAVLLRAGEAGTPGYRLFVDTSLALYCWDVLTDVALSLDGGVVGAAQSRRD